MRLGLQIIGFSIALAAATPLAIAETWTGVYLGGTMGRRTVDAEWTTTCLAEGLSGPSSCPDFGGTYADRFPIDNPAQLSDADTRLGLYAGAQLQWDVFVVGAEGDWGNAKNKLKHGGIPGAELPGRSGQKLDEVSVTADWDASLRGRLGILITPTTMLFATGGVSWIKVEASAFCGVAFENGWCGAPTVGTRETISDILRGYTVGLGLETLITDNIILRGEYRHASYDTIQHIFFLGLNDNQDTITARIETETDTFSVGLAYKF